MDISDILQIKNTDILRKDYNQFHYLSTFYGDYLPKYNWVGDISCKITVRALGVQMRDVDFVETSLTFGRISAVPP
jgi:hypothetical protein